MFARKAISRCGLVMMTQTRNIRGVRKVFRQKLPKYKNDLFDLPNCDEMVIKNELGRLDELWSSRVDFYKLYMPLNQSFTLLEALFNPNNDIDTLLRIIDENLPTMNSFYLATSLEALNDMMQLQICDINTVLVSPEFKNLCKKTLLKLRFFEADEVLKLVHCLSSLQLPEDSLIVQSALQMIRHLLNDFTIKELESLSSALEGIQITDASTKSLLAALKKAVPLRLRVTSDESQVDRFPNIDNDKQISPKQR